jgi:ACS family glucarate transporter-like MFS transporter
LIDRFGPRLALTRVVICWSFFTAATGLAWNFTSMLAARLLFGAGEAGCFPGLAKTFSNWLPVEERARAEGWKASSARWGAGAAPLLVVVLYASLGWRVTFVLFGAIGFVWAGLSYFLQRTDRNEVSVVVARPVPRRSFLRSRRARALCDSHGVYFYVTWLPTYLLQARGVSLKHGAILSGLPLFTAGCGCLFAGDELPPAARWYGIVRARKSIACP